MAACVALMCTFVVPRARAGSDAFPPIPLPPPDAPTASISAALGAVEAGEAQQVAPGPVDDSELVRVTVDRDGRVVAVVVEQTLTVTGVGDFRLRVPGPALDVTALHADATILPGLQRGGVVWQGFASGRRELGARITLDPAQEQFRLPFTVTATTHEIVLHNQTSQPVPVVTAEPDAGALRATAAAVAAHLARSERPLAGVGDIPASIPALGPATAATAAVASPLHVVGSIETAGDRVRVDQVLGGESDVRFRVRDAVTRFSLTIVPSLPAFSYRPDTPPRAMLEQLERTLAATARAASLDAYLGNPNPGRSKTVFTVTTASTTRPRRAAPHHGEPLTLALACLAAVLILGVAFAWWRVN